MKIVKFFAAVVVCFIVAAAGFYAYAVRHPALAEITPQDKITFSPELVEKGESLAGLGNCAVCHTAEGGEDFAGGLALPTPFGTIYSTNITPDAETGIGGWSEEAFIRAVKLGVDRKGQHLYPAFPYDYYTRVTDEDLKAIYAYLMTLAPVSAKAPENDLPFPFNQRELLAGWKLLFLDTTPIVPNPDKDEDWNRGQYLVEGLGHCGACHSPRNALGAAVKTGEKAYAGGEAEGWYAPALNQEYIAQVPWNVDSLANYLIDGWDRDHGPASGPMRPVVDDLYMQSEDDVVAIATYILDLMGGEPDNVQELTYKTREKAKSLEWGHASQPELPTEPVLAQGAQAFQSYCSDCHKSSSTLAPLAVTGAMRSVDARNFIEVVLHGINPAPQGSPARNMPPRALQLNDEELISLVAFARDRFSDGPAWENVTELVKTARERMNTKQ